MSAPLMPVGFDYARAILDLRAVLTYDQIAEELGYENKGSISDIVNKGVIPSHVHGEALFALYLRVFKHKPPMSKEQAIGAFVGKSERHMMT